MKQYDYIVVGAGSAGCALARRLSDEPSAQVLLIEAGGSDDRSEIVDPSAYYRLWGSEIDWRYASTAQAGTSGRVHAMPRGRVLGGTSSINGMVYLRGARTDYDAWAADGCAGWDWAGVVPAFESMEKLLRPRVVDEHNPLSEVFLTAAYQAGFSANYSFDSGTLDGAGWNRSTILNGRRHNSFQAFLSPVLNRPNLTVLTNTLANRLLFKSKASVSGVETCDTDHTGFATYQASEVVLCAGAFDSPRLLMQSGIGPQKHLGEVGIAPRIDLPVGENLIDHLLIGVVYTSKQAIPIQHPHLTECCAFGTSSGGTTPDVEISFNKEAHFAPETDDGVPRYTLIPGITQPKSRGTIRLQATDVTAPPLIDPGYFAVEDDMRAMIESIRMTREIGSMPAFDEWNGGEFFPGELVASDTELRRYVSDAVSTWFHPVGTCRMGIRQDAVVDPRLSVHGIDGLRVADASIMPDIVSVNTNAASTMIGWKAGSLILDG